MTMGVAAVLNRYQKVQVTTCSPGELLVMLYDGVFRFLGEAKTQMIAGERTRAAELISKSHKIFQHLLGGLNFEVAPDLCKNLQSLYVFCMGHIVQANIKQNPANLDEVLRVLTPLREAWTTVVRGSKVDASATGNVTIANLSSPISIK
jgi:flagellar protein FliS